MAAANESQGLKIVVAVCVSLVVILLVSTYFLYTSYDDATQKLKAAEAKTSEASNLAQKTLRNLQDLRDRAGYKQFDVVDDIAPLKAEIEKDQQKAVEKLAGLQAKVDQAVAEAQAKGASDQEIQNYRDQAAQILARFQSPDVPPNFATSLDTLADMTRNMAELTVEFARDNVRLRSDLTAANQINQEKLAVQEGAARSANTDKETQLTNHETDRQKMLAQVDQLTTQNSQLASENATMKTRLTQQEEDNLRELENVRNQLRSVRNQLAANENILDSADGLVTYVDNSRREIRTNITRRMGARPNMIMAIFDAGAQSMGADKPKGRIKLIQVGENDSVAQITNVTTTSNPIREGDQVYSAAWSPGEPLRMALIGKMDIDRDGRDDRGNLIRLIQAAGGIIEYDLPPPGVGRESGELTGQSRWYVIDDRGAFRPETNRKESDAPSADQQAFEEKRAAAIRKAESLGVQPIRIDRLLSSLGYSQGMVVPGNVEAANRTAIDNLLNPRGRSAPVQPTEDNPENN